MKTTEKWVWSNDQVEEVLMFVPEYKSKCDLKGDVLRLYTKMRRQRLNLYPDDFGTPCLTTHRVVPGGRLTLPMKVCL